MPWVEVFVVFVVSHVTGDFLLQTEFQALGKAGGVRRGTGDARRALGLHALTYAACFIPALIWLSDRLSVLELIGTLAGIIVPHALLDDGLFVSWWMEHVKHTPAEPGVLTIAVDQSFHFVALFVLAVVVGV